MEFAKPTAHKEMDSMMPSSADLKIIHAADGSTHAYVPCIKIQLYESTWCLSKNSRTPNDNRLDTSQVMMNWLNCIHNQGTYQMVLWGTTNLEKSRIALSQYLTSGHASTK